MKYINNIQKTLQEVYSDKKYFILSGLFSLWVFSLNALISNYKLIISEFSFLLLFNLIISAHSAMSELSFFFLILVSLLSGIVFSLSIFLLRRQINYSAGIGLSGVITSVLTPACSSCALGLTGLLGISGTLSVLPFKGLELGILGIILLLFSLIYLSQKITTTICEVKK